MRQYLTPRMLGAHLLVLLSLAVAGGLGVWQYEAWQSRRGDEAVDLTRLDPVALSDVMGPDESFPGADVGRPVDLDGTWVLDATVLVSGREHEGRDGYWVVTPVSVGGDGRPAIPVVRGWTADPGQAPDEPSGPARLTGWLQPPEGTGATDDDPRDDVFPQLRVADLAQRVDVDLYSAYAVATRAGDGLERADLAALPSAGRFTAVRNLLYAFEWWVFGAFAAFIWWRFVRESTGDRDAGGSSGSPAAPPPARTPDPVPSEP